MLVKWLVVYEVKKTSLEDELVLQVKELPSYFSYDVKDVIDDVDVETLLMVQPICMKRLIEDLKHKVSVL